jgi:hypothetical protein
MAKLISDAPALPELNDRRSLFKQTRDNAFRW